MFSPVPFDDNYINLASSPADDVTYVNASRIEFRGCSQKFLASSAPKPASFKQFWHMVIQEKVSVIVMITKLVENNKRKAHQYWPEEEGREPMGQVLDLGADTRVEHVSTSCEETYLVRLDTFYTFTYRVFQSS